MPGDGSCFCGKVKVHYEGDPQLKALCHCTDCHKIAGTAFSTNIAVLEDGFKVTGSPKEISKTGDSGNKITSHFCGDCGTTMYRDGASFPGMKIIKVGVLDDPKKFENAVPTVELFTPQRAPWVQPIPNAQQAETMPG